MIFRPDILMLYGNNERGTYERTDDAVSALRVYEKSFLPNNRIASLNKFSVHAVHRTRMSARRMRGGREHGP